MGEDERSGKMWGRIGEVCWVVGEVSGMWGSMGEVWKSIWGKCGGCGEKRKMCGKVRSVWGNVGEPTHSFTPLSHPHTHPTPLPTLPWHVFLHFPTLTSHLPILSHTFPHPYHTLTSSDTFPSPFFLIDFFIFILLSWESDGGAMCWTNPDSLRSCLFQVFRLNFLPTFLICCSPDSTKQR